MVGMMLQQEGSRHVWLEGLPALDLIVTMNGATSEISRKRSRRIVVPEPAGGCRGVWAILCSVCGSQQPLNHTPQTGERVSGTQLTQWDGLWRDLAPSTSHRFRRRRAAARSERMVTEQESREP
jgi:hypothetical protein